MPRELDEGLLRVRVDAIPPRRPHERQHRRHRRLLRERRAIGHARTRARIGIALVIANALFEAEREVVEAPREETDVIEPP